MGWIRREGSGTGEKWVDLRNILDLGLGELDNGLQVESFQNSGFHTSLSCIYNKLSITFIFYPKL